MKQSSRFTWFFTHQVRSACWKYKYGIAILIGLLLAAFLISSPSHMLQKVRSMLTITVSHKAAHAIEYQKAALSKEGNYYMDTQIKAYWAGKTSKYLGIEGKEVTEESFARLAHRLHPEIEGEKLGVRDNDDARAGVDLTFSAPKCVTLLHSLTQNSDILDMHRRSYQAAMLEAEKMMHTQKNTRYARGYIRTGNLIYAAFDHFLSRPVDVELGNQTLQIASPNLHTHCFVGNTTFNEEAGRYQACEIYNLHKNSDYLRTVYHNHLALELEAAGYQTERDGNFIKLAGVSRDLIERFAERSLEINRIAAEKGLTAKQKGELGKLTRKAKSRMSMSEQQLYEHWLTRLSEAELKKLQSLQGQTFSRLPPITVKQAVDRSLEYAFERNSVENEKKIIAYGTKLGYGQFNVHEVAKELQSRGNLLKSERDTIEYVTTRELVHEENRMIEMATSGKGKFAALNKDYQPKLDFLNDQQRRAIQDILSSYDQTMILRGAPGVGKTSLLTEVRDGVLQNGKSFYAIAPSSQAAQVLAEKGFESDTIAGLLSSPQRQANLRNNVLLIDEAGMVGVKNMSALLEISEKYKCRTILSGDSAQNQAPAQYGDSLAILEKQSRLQVSTVDKIMRQKAAPEYQSAVTDIYKGRILQGYQKLNRQGHVIEIPHYEERIEKIAQDYVDSLAKKRSTLIVSPTHNEGDLINQAVRKEMKAKNVTQGAEKAFETLKDISLTVAEKKDHLSYQKGHVVRFIKNQKGGYRAGSHHEVINVTKDQKVQVRDLSTGAVSNLPYEHPVHYSVHSKQTVMLCVGDRIRLTNNAMSLEGTRMANGTSYQVKGFNQRGVELTNGKTIPNNLYHLRYGYTDTSFSSQGKDAHTVLLSMSDLSQGGINQKSFLVGVSRGTRAVRVYTSDKDFLKKSITRSADRLSAIDIAEDQQRLRKRQQRGYQKELQQKMRSHERLQGREKTPTRSISKDHHTR